MLDQLKAAVRHFVILCIGAALTVVGQEVVPALQGTGEWWGPAAAALVSMAVLWLTPLTRQYGVGRDE